MPRAKCALAPGGEFARRGGGDPLRLKRTGQACVAAIAPRGDSSAVAGRERQFEALVRMGGREPKLAPRNLGGGRSWLDEVDGDVDIAASGAGVGAGLVSLFDEGLGDSAIEIRKRDVEAGGEGEVARGKAQIDFGVDDGVRGKLDLPLVGDVLDGGEEAGRPASREELLGIGACTGTWHGELHIEMAIVGAGSAAIAAAGGVGFGGIEVLIDVGDRGLRSLSGLRHGDSFLERM